MSIAPGPQEWFVKEDYPREERIAAEVPAGIVERLRTMPEFVKAYEPEGMKPEGVSDGVTQRTLCQFVESGWRLLEEAR